MRSPCIGCAFEHQQKNNEVCDNCKDRLRHEGLKTEHEQEEEYRERLLTVSEATMGVDMADLRADESSHKKRGPKLKKEDNVQAHENVGKVTELQNIVVNLLVEHFRDKKHQAKEVDAALRSLNAIAKIKATERVKDATQFAVLRELADNKKEFQKYIAMSLPHLNPMKQVAV